MGETSRCIRSLSLEKFTCYYQTSGRFTDYSVYIILQPEIPRNNTYFPYQNSVGIFNRIKPKS